MADFRPDPSVVITKHIQPRFGFGGSSKDVCDCLGYLLYQFRANGKSCSWEKDIPRKFLTFNEMLEIVSGLKTIRVGKGFAMVDKNPSFVLMQDGRTSLGHLGWIVRETGQILHMTEYGVRELVLKDGFVDRLDYFIYLDD